MLTILSIAYPMAAVGRNAVGGAEQVLTQLDTALVQLGHRSVVVACEGAETAGVLLETPKARGLLHPEERRRVHECYRRTIDDALNQWPVDLVHMHGIDFYEYLPRRDDVPVLTTLHLPPGWYPPEIFHQRRPNIYLHCVSATQQRACPANAGLLPVIPNGVAVEEFDACCAKRRFVLALGRICPEKGFHHALDAARRVGIPMLLAGEVFPYPAHIEYFDREIAPRLDRERRFIGPVGFARKRRLLAAAQCLLVPSLAPETSSLVTLEALASGTPVIAFPSGALPEIVEHGRTGWIVNDEAEMAAAIPTACLLDPHVCRKAARERFSLQRTIDSYLALYHELVDASRARDRHEEVAHAD